MPVARSRQDNGPIRRPRWLKATPCSGVTRAAAPPRLETTQSDERKSTLQSSARFEINAMRSPSGYDTGAWLSVRSVVNAEAVPLSTSTIQMWL